MRILSICLMLSLAACATPRQGVRTETRIDQAMKEAAAARPATNDQINKALLPPLVVDLPRSVAKTVDTRFDIAVNSAPASEVFAAIASGSHWSIVVHPSIKETIALQLKNVTVFEALDTVREMYGYEYAVHGSRILIQPIGMQTRVFALNYLMSQRESKSETRVSSGAIMDSSNGSQTNNTSNASGSNQSARALESSRVVTTSNSDFWVDLAKTVKGIVGADAGRSVVVNAQAGVLVVRAMPQELRAVADFIKTMQNVVSRQVMLEAKIIEVQLRDGAETGINWAAFATGNNHRVAGGVLTPGATLGASGTLSGFTSRGADGSVVGNSEFSSNPAFPGSANLGSSAAGSIFGLALQTTHFASLLSFLETQGDLHVLSSPRIATINNQKAVLKVGTDEFFVTGVTNNQTSPSVGTVQNSPTITVQPFFSGIALDVTPQIDESGYIILHVHPSVSSVVEKSKSIDLGSSGNFKLPLAASTINESDTVVRVNDGNIVAIGGLMKETVLKQRSGVPFLSDIPLAGHLFKSRSDSVVKSELVILIKPTVILGDDDWKKDVRGAQERISELERTAVPRQSRKAR